MTNDKSDDEGDDEEDGGVINLIDVPAKSTKFDEDITIEFLDFILDVVYPGMKVGISWDMAPAHNGAKVKAYVERRTREGQLVLGYINGGLTSVLQICDLVVNKKIKAIIKEMG